MWLNRCKDCKKWKLLTKHSEIGGHQPPYIHLCEECHQKRHGNIKKYSKKNVKIQPGTRHRRRIKKNKGN